jgi:hypothetical protein
VVSRVGCRLWQSRCVRLWPVVKGEAEATREAGG